jgi:hypothetical protein
VTFTQASSASIEAEQQRGAEVDFLFGEGENPRRRRQELVNKTYPTMRTQQQKLSNFIIFL